MRSRFITISLLLAGAVGLGACSNQEATPGSGATPATSAAAAASATAPVATKVHGKACEKVGDDLMTVQFVYGDTDLPGKARRIFDTARGRL